MHKFTDKPGIVRDLLDDEELKLQLELTEPEISQIKINKESEKTTKLQVKLVASKKINSLFFISGHV